MHGFNSYPESFSILAELQTIIDISQINHVIAKVLKHLNQIRVFESSENIPKYIKNMVT